MLTLQGRKLRILELALHCTQGYTPVDFVCIATVSSIPLDFYEIAIVETIDTLGDVTLCPFIVALAISHAWVFSLDNKGCLKGLKRSNIWSPPWNKKRSILWSPPWNKKRSILWSPPFEGGRKGDQKGDGRGIKRGTEGGSKKAAPRFELGVKALQAPALPLGDAAA